MSNQTFTNGRLARTWLNDAGGPDQGFVDPLTGADTVGELFSIASGSAGTRLSPAIMADEEPAALNLIFITPGNYTIDDDGIPGNNTSVIRDGTGTVIFTFVHPADSLGFTVSTPGVNLTINFTDSLSAANFTIGSLTDPAQTPDSITVRNINTTGVVTLVSNGAIIEGGADAATDIVAGTLIMSAVSGVGTAANAIETQTAALEAETTTGGINLSNFGNVTIGALTDQVDGLDVATSGDISLTNVGTISLGEVDLDTGNPPPAALESVHGGSTSGNITLTALGIDSDILATSNRDAITASSGSIFLTAGRDVAFGTAGANFDNDVRASGVITVNAGRDFLIDGFADLESDNFGLSTGGDVTINAGRNIHVRAVTGSDAGIAATGNAGADIFLTAGTNGALLIDPAISSTIRSQSGGMLINADRLLIAAASGLTASSGSITIRPRTDGREIVLGSGTDAAFALELSDTELDRIFTPTLTIGSDTGGNVRVGNPVSPANVPNLILRSGTDILVQASMTVTTSLTLRAGDNVFVLPSTINVPTFVAFADQAGDDGNTGGIINVNALVASTSATLTGNAEADTLIGTSADESIFGLAGNDTLRGNGGKDSLDGGTGADSMAGGLGDDIYAVDNAGDIVTEAVGEGNDRILASVSYVLTSGSEVELLTAANLAGTNALDLTGNALAQIIIGNDGANTLSGLGGDDTLQGLGGNDSLDGGAGADTMFGGAGDDIYVVDNSGDQAIEAAGEGSNDRVLASANFTLNVGSEVELLAALDLAGVGALDLTGNDLAQIVIGNDGVNNLFGRAGNDTLQGLGGNDSLDGGAGADTMFGGLGDDIYAVDNAGDQAIEAVGQGSNDRVLASVNYQLGVGSEIELIAALDLAGTGALDLTGNELGQTIIGNAGVNALGGGGGNDTLQGLEGSDLLDGGLGADMLVGGTGADLLVFASALGGGNIDTIIGFVSGTDGIAIDNSVFTGLANGALPASAFVVGSGALDADDRIIYDPATGALFFDADGNGGVDAVQFAVLQGAPPLAASDFSVI